MKLSNKLSYLLVVLSFVTTLSASGELIALTAQSYNKTIKESQKPIFVKFWAPWCGGCKEMAPAYEHTAKRYKDKIIFAELNIDRYGRFAASKGVKAVPTIILYKNGEELDRITMSLNKKQLEIWTEMALEDKYRFEKKKN